MNPLRLRRLERRRATRRGVVPALLAFVLASTTVVAAPVGGPLRAPEASAATTFKDGYFREYTLFSGLTRPMSVRFASDGRAFVAEKGGLIKAFDSMADTTPTTVIDLRPEVMTYWDRGLLGIAVDPDFLAGRPYLYAYYVYDAPPGKTAPYWNDACKAPPDGPGAIVDGCPATSKLVRITVDPATNVATGTPKQLIRDWCQQFPSHSGGGIAFGADKQLYVSGGDGASFATWDYGQLGGTVPNYSNPYTPVNPCNDPVKVTSAPGTKPVVEVRSAQGGSLRVQDVRTSGDSLGLAGTIIRINPDTGAGSPGNPLSWSTSTNAKRIIAHGFRNPFRMTFRPGTNSLYVGDVGSASWDEINKVSVPSSARTKTTMPNYGWPCYEGAPRANYARLGTAMCDNLFAQGSGAVRKPLYGYAHKVGSSPNGPCFAPDSTGVDGASVSGLAFYRPRSGAVPYPSRFTGALFFVDYARKCMAALLPDANGVPDPAKLVTVAEGVADPVDLVAGPTGDLVYTDIGSGRVIRIGYAVRPTAKIVATPSMGRAPRAFELDGSSSVDPDPATSITAWEWDLDADGAYDDAAGATHTWNVTTPGMYTVGLRVTSSNGLSDTTTLGIDATNDPPVPSIDSPSQSLTWSVGDEIAFSGSASDAQDGSLPASSLSWDVVMQHCPGACHAHVVETITGASGSFIAPDHEYPSHLELRLTATDSAGVKRTTSVALQPKTATISLASAPSGVTMSVADTPVKTPGQATVIRGGTPLVTPPLTATLGGVRHRFERWEDDLTRVRSVKADGPVSLAAVYVPDVGDTCAGATTKPTKTWVEDRASGNGDVDWFRFTLSSARRVVVTAGDLPVDATLSLYGSCSASRIAVSSNPGTRFEEITRVLAAGTYRVKVSFVSGARSTTPYVLRFRPLAAGVVTKSWRTTSGGAGGGAIRIAGEVLNNTGSATGRALVTATFRDAGGSVVGTLTGRSFARHLAVGDVSPFVLTGTVPAYASVSLTVAPRSASAKRNLEASAVTRTPNPDGTVTETGTVRNAGTVTVSDVEVARTWYGRRGQVLDRRTAPLTPSTLAPGTTGSFTILRPVLEGVQASRTRLRAL